MTLAPSRALAQAILTVDLDALQANWRRLSAASNPSECGAVVKADAYGSGLEEATLALAKAGCASFFVAHPFEGVRAREALKSAGAQARIFVLNGFAALASAAAACAQSGLVPMLGDLGDAELWRAQAAKFGAPLPAALMFDTGMNRLGFDWRRAADVAAWLAAAPSLRPVLIASHFVASSFPEDPLNGEQIARFEQARRHFPGLPASLANSSGLFLPQRPLFDLGRPGYALYGGNPTPGLPNPMNAVIRLEARVLQVREIAAGETVGYDAQWTAPRPTRLAAIGVGYADGLPRNAMATDERAGGEAIVAGRRCAFAGRVSMDVTMIDVTDVPAADIAPGSLVELLGETITVDDLGARAQTIGYEILTNLGRRYARRHRRSADADADQT